MMVDEPGFGPPPPSAEAMQLAELRRAELLTMTRSQSTPWWMAIFTGSMFAVEAWAFSLPVDLRGLVVGAIGVLAILIQILFQRRAGITPVRSRHTPRSLATPSYRTFAYVAVGAFGLYGLWQIVPWTVVAGCAFVLGASAQLFQRRALAAAVRRLEFEAFPPPPPVSS